MIKTSVKTKLIEEKMDKLLFVYCNAKTEYETSEMFHVIKVRV